MEKSARVSLSRWVLMFLLGLGIIMGTYLTAFGQNGIPDNAARTLPGPEGKVSADDPEALQDDIPDWRARWELARVLSYVKQYDDSIQEYRKVLQEKPGLPGVRAELARILYWNGRSAEALQELENIPPENADGATKALMADIYMSQKKYPQAESLYRSYLQQHPDDLKVRLNLARMLSWQKRYDDSLSEYKKLLKLRPDDFQVRRQYAFVLIWAGRYPEAAAELRKTLQ